MKNGIFISLLLLLISTKSIASLIAYDLVNSTSLNLLEQINPYENVFDSKDDASQKYSPNGLGDIPKALLDASFYNQYLDAAGVVITDNTDEFFGVTDTKNPDNISGLVTSRWLFNIEQASQLMLSINIAAMGDFEQSDTFGFSYIIDGGQEYNLFSSSVDETTSQKYRLINNENVLDDPFVIGNTLLSNKFTTFTKAIIGTGHILELKFKANMNGSNEALAFQNIIVSDSISVPEPSTIILISIGFWGIFITRKSGVYLHRIQYYL